jgi:hypothetical protein
MGYDGYIQHGAWLGLNKQSHPLDGFAAPRWRNMNIA